MGSDFLDKYIQRCMLELRLSVENSTPQDSRLFEKRSILMSSEQQGAPPVNRAAVATLIIGLASILLFGVVVLIGFFVEEIGIVSIMSIAVIPALIALVLGMVTRQQPDGRRMAMLGIILACVTLFLALFFWVATFLFFIPWLFA
jgi:hypothetical protein